MCRVRSAIRSLILCPAYMHRSYLLLACRRCTCGYVLRLDGCVRSRDEGNAPATTRSLFLFASLVIRMAGQGGAQPGRAHIRVTRAGRTRELAPSLPMKPLSPRCRRWCFRRHCSQSPVVFESEQSYERPMHGRAWRFYASVMYSACRAARTARMLATCLPPSS